MRRCRWPAGNSGWRWRVAATREGARLLRTCTPSVGLPGRPSPSPPRPPCIPLPPFYLEESIFINLLSTSYIDDKYTYIHTYYSRVVPEGVTDASQIFFRDTHVLPKLFMRNTADVTGGKPIAALLQSISGVSAINPLVAFYDVHGGKREVLFFYFVPDTTRDDKRLCY
jgi:hypothetical protein